MTVLPEGWAEAPLVEVADVIFGQAPPGDTYRKDGRGLPLYQGKTDFTDLYVGPPRIWTTGATKTAAPNDVLLSVRAPVGPTNLAAAPCAIGRGLAAVRGRRGVHQRYLLYVLRHLEEKLAAKATGTTFPAVTGSVVRDQRVPVPPLAEQERIVAAVEEQFSRLDAGVVALARARRHVGLMRASVLQRAASGRVMQEATEPSTKWRMRPIRDVAHMVVDGDHNPPKRTTGGVPHLTARNVRRGALTLNGCTFVSEEDFARMRRRYDPRPGDVIVTCVGTLGATAIVPHGLAFSADRNLAAIRPTDEVDSAFLKLVLDSPHWQQRMRDVSGSTAQPHLYLGDLRELLVPVPTRDEQARVVRQTQELLTGLAAIADSVTVAERRSRALRSSILAAAFCGKLVPQDPSDEPASVLLERIAAERAASSNCKRPARKPHSQASLWETPA